MTHHSINSQYFLPTNIYSKFKNPMTIKLPTCQWKYFWSHDKSGKVGKIPKYILCLFFIVCLYYIQYILAMEI